MCYSDHVVAVIDEVALSVLVFDVVVVAYAALFRTPKRANDESVRMAALVQKSAQ